MLAPGSYLVQEYGCNAVDASFSRDDIIAVTSSCLTSASAGGGLGRTRGASHWEGYFRIITRLYLRY